MTKSTHIAAAVVRYLTTDHGVRPALLIPGDKKGTAVLNDAERGLHTVACTLDDIANASPVDYKGGEYPAALWAAGQIATTTRKTAQRAYTKAAMALCLAVAGDTPVPTHSPDDTADGPKGERAKSTRGNVVAAVCAELSLAPKAARRILRAAGLRAPYEDAAAVRAALTAKATKPAVEPTAPTTDAKPKRARKVAAKPVAADGQPLVPELSVASRRAAARRPSKAVKIEVQAAA